MACYCRLYQTSLYNVVTFFQCLANLARWEDLEQCTVGNIDDTNPPDLDKVWTDTFFQVRFSKK